MTEKEFRKIENWQEWLELWEKNNLEEIAIGLLHAGPEVYQFFSQDGLKNELERVRVYLKVAGWDEHPRNTPERVIGSKAYQVLVHILLWKLTERMKERWASRLQPTEEAEVWGEIINFFATSRRSFHLDGEPYRSKARTFLTSIHSSLMGKTGESFSFHPETKKVLLQRKEGLATALVKVGAFDYILREEIFETIPALKERIFDEGCELRRRFSESKEWWVNVLEMPRSRRFVEVLRYKGTQETARTLMELLIKRDALSSVKM